MLRSFDCSTEYVNDEKDESSCEDDIYAVAIQFAARHDNHDSSPRQ